MSHFSLVRAVGNPAVCLLCALLGVHLGAEAAALPTPGCAYSAFQVYWNIVDNANGTDAPQKGPQLDNSTLASQWLFTRGDQTITRGNEGGLWPYCSTDPTGNPVSVLGGIPQLGNLSGHLALLRSDIASGREGMDANFTGNAVIDFEMWRPVFSGQWNDPCYANLSIALVRQQHPDWTNESQIYAQAELDFETAGMSWFVESLTVGKALVPGAAWGFYGYPANLFQPCVNAGQDPQCGYHHPTAGPAQRAINDEKYAPLWAASTGLFSSVYLNSWTRDPSGAWASRNRDYVAGTVEEMARVARNRAAVRPFAWNYYMDGVGGADGDLLQFDLDMLLSWPLYAGADGLVFWGAPYYAGHNFPSPSAGLADFYAFLHSTLGPTVQDVVLANCACSAANCSSAGACIGPGTCRCLPGYSGDTCNVTAQGTS